MRAAVLTGARATLLAGPTVLAFFSGGYFPEAQAWAGLVVWVLVAVAVLTIRRPILTGAGARLALGAIALLALWTLLSFAWAPIAGSAYHAGQRAIMYAGALFAASLLLRDRPATRAVEPALAAGTLIVIGYGLSERLVPGLLHFQRSVSAEGRLEQPLTYWNAMGEVAAMGFVLCARMAGDSTRSRWLRVVAVAGSAPLGMGLYVTFSRGALFAWGAGLVTLIVVAPRREQLEAILLSASAGMLAALAAAPFHSVTSLSGSLGTREGQGAIVLALLLVVMGAAAAAGWLRFSPGRSAELRLPRRAPWIAVAAICAGLGLAVVAGAKERSTHPLSGGATRLVTLQSNRYAYWRVAVRAFRAEPFRGVGAGGWAVDWLRYRTIDESAQDAHSLELQTLAELGLIGAALLIAFLVGVALAARAAHASAPGLAAGAIAGSVTYLAHSPLDWDWQMPAVTLIAIGLAGALLALSARDDGSVATAPRRSEALRA
jgi:hypothetical protein